MNKNLSHHEPLLRGVALKFNDYPMDGVDSHHVQLLRTGVFYHPEYGEIQITQGYLQNMIKNFNDKVRGIDLAIDYAHNNDSIAAGWIENLFLSGDNEDELWAKVRWTNRGKQVVLDQEFKYLSAEFHNNYVNNETQQAFGPTLLGAGLTNRPFVKGMSPVLELSEKPKQEGMNQMDEKDKKIAEQEAQIATLKKQIEQLQAEDQGEGDSGSMDAMASELADAKKKLQEYADKEAAACKEKALAEKKSQFNKLLSEGKAVEAQREHFMSGDAVKFAEAWVAPTLKSTGSSGDAPQDSEPKTREEAQKRVVELAEKMVLEKKAHSIGFAQHKVLSENPALKNLIY